MQSRAALIFLLGFVILIRAASAHSWATVGVPLTTHAFATAVLLASMLSGAWYAYQVAHRPSVARPHHGHLMIARWSSGMNQ